MKKLIFMLLFMMAAVAVVAETHTVQRGETLQSIAQAYRITEAELVAANPGVENLFYVGMKLEIPQTMQQPAVQGGNGSGVGTLFQNYNPSESQTMPMQNGSTPPVQHGNPTPVDSEIPQEKEGPGFDVCFYMSYDFIPKETSYYDYDHGFAMQFQIGFNYWVTEKQSGFFAGLMLGYRPEHWSTQYRRGVKDINWDFGFLTPTIQLGYALMTEDKNWGVTPYVACDFNLGVRAKEEYDNKKESIKKFNNVNLRIGGQIRICKEFNVGASYVFALSDNVYYDSYFAINLGFGF